MIHGYRSWQSQVLLQMMAFSALTAIAFVVFGLDDNSQALGLREGSVRAVVALSLVPLFTILSVYLYGSLAASSQLQTARNLARSDALGMLAILPPSQIVGVLDKSNQIGSSAVG